MPWKRYLEAAYFYVPFPEKYLEALRRLSRSSPNTLTPWVTSAALSRAMSWNATPSRKTRTAGVVGKGNRGREDAAQLLEAMGKWGKKKKKGLLCQETIWIVTITNWYSSDDCGHILSVILFSIPALVFDGVDVNCDGWDEETYTHIRGQKRTTVVVL
jgi:hypothetical protein